MNKIVYVKYEDSNQHYAFLNDIEDLDYGDYVLTDTKRGLAVGRVVGFGNNNDKAERLIVTKICEDNWLNLKARYKKIKNEIKVGDVVAIVDKGKLYTTLNENHVPQVFQLRYAYDDYNIDTDERYIVKGKFKHKSNGRTLYVIEPSNSYKLYIIAEDGIEKYCIMEDELPF